MVISLADRVEILLSLYALLLNAQVRRRNIGQGIPLVDSSLQFIKLILLILSKALTKNSVQYGLSTALL